MSENGARANGNPLESGDFVGPRKDSSLILDDKLSSAASPFLYLFSVLVIVVAAYLLYSFIHT